MKRMHLSAALLAAAIALSACGGGIDDPITVADVNAHSAAPRVAPAGGFKQMVVFGDSLSDDGAYTAVLGANATVPDARGGTFSVNTGGHAIWSDILASSLGLSLAPNVVNWTVAGQVMYLLADGTLVPDVTQGTCAFNPSQPSGRPACTDYAQGGSKVADPNGLGHDAGATTLPVTTQLGNHLAHYGRFAGDELVTVLAGNNDVLGAANAVAGGQQSVPQAEAAVGAAADALVAQVQGMLNNGARYVVVYTLPNFGLTPRGQNLGPGGQCDIRNPQLGCFLLSALAQIFNQRLLDGLDGRAVKMVDGYALLNDEMARPAAYGFDNVTTPWCDPGLASSLICTQQTANTAGGATTANLPRWLFADDLHPTPAGHAVIVGATRAAMHGFGWL